MDIMDVDVGVKMRKNYQIVTIGCLCEPGTHENCGDLRTARLHSILWTHGYHRVSNKMHGCEIIRKWNNPITKKTIKEIHICGGR